MRVRLADVPCSAMASLRAAFDLLSTIVTPSGDPASPAYRLYFSEAAIGSNISPWHDIPLFVDESKSFIMHAVIEIPKG